MRVRSWSVLDLDGAAEGCSVLAAAALLAGALNSDWTTVLPGRLNHDVGVDRSGGRCSIGLISFF